MSRRTSFDASRTSVPPPSHHAAVRTPAVVATRRELRPWLGWALLASAVAALATGTLRFGDDPAAAGITPAVPAAPGPVAAVPAAPAVSVPTTALRVLTLHSRYAGPGLLEVWGRSNAPQGATVRIAVRVPGGRWRTWGTAPVADGRFYATGTGGPRSLRLRARVVG